MAKPIHFLGQYTVYKTMCDGCATSIANVLDAIPLPANTRLLYDAEPGQLGEQHFQFYIEADETPNKQAILLQIKTTIQEAEFTVRDKLGPEPLWQRKNGINIIANLASLVLTTLLFYFLSPSLTLTLCFSGIALATTAYTGRDYLRAFYQKAKQKQFLNMPSIITAGWLLALAHGIYHVMQMPMMHEYNMVFMTFVMPLCLFLILNVMDLIRERMYQNLQKITHNKEQNIFGFTNEYRAARCLNKPKALNLQGLTLRNKHTLTEGMEIEVKPGDAIPTDGILLYANARLDTSIINGELNKVVESDQLVYSGSINRSDKPIYIYSEKTPYKSTANNIMMRANREALERSTRYWRFAYAYAAVYTLCLAAAIAAPGILGELTPSVGMRAVLAILFAICPCTLVIAHKFPSLLLCREQSKQNITFRDQNFFSYAPEPKTIVFDKTGTLTLGTSKVHEASKIDDALLQKVAGLEKAIAGHHPIAKAIIEHTANAETTSFENTHYDEKHRGISGFINGDELIVGNAEFLKIKNINNDKFTDYVSQYPHLTPVYVAQDHVCKGVILIEHTIRPGVINTLQTLKDSGCNIIMLTGDNPDTANAFNQRIGSLFPNSNIIAGKQPAEKEAYITTVMENEKNVWFVGDGLNDSPCARIVSEKGGLSCAIGSNTKAAYFCDIALNERLDYLTQFKSDKHRHDCIVNQNQGLLMLNGFAIFALILSAGFQGFLMPPMAPMAFMVLTTVLTFSNSYRVNSANNQPFYDFKFTDTPANLVKKSHASSASYGNGKGLQPTHQPRPPEAPRLALTNLQS